MRDGRTDVSGESFETLKRAWLHVRQHRYLWPIAFVIALTGGTAQGFSLWAQSPLSRGLTAINPIQRIGVKITDFARGNTAFWALFVIIGFIVGLILLAAGAFAQVSAVGAVSDIEFGRPSGLKSSLEWGKRRFGRYFALTVCYLVLLAVFAAPSYIFWWTLGKKGFAFSCVGALVLGLLFVLVSLLAGIVFELAARFLVLGGHGIRESVQLAGIMLKQSWRELLPAWLYVLLITIMGAVAMIIVVTVLSIPLSWIFTTADRHHNGFLLALSMAAFFVAWAAASACAGIFSMTASAMWTLTFIDLE